jgi:hypothetical protein
MGSVNPPSKRDYGDKTRIDMNQVLPSGLLETAFWRVSWRVLRAVKMPL